MWIIKMKFVGKEGTYTKEEETVADEFWCKIKYRDMLKRWKDILCEKAIVRPGLEDVDIILKTIQFNLSLLNDGSTFEISMEEIKD